MRSTQPPSTDPALQLESELYEELGRAREIVDHNANVVHPLDRHVFDGDATLELRLHAPEDHPAIPQWSTR
jgi:hypothetical protein